MAMFDYKYLDAFFKSNQDLKDHIERNREIVLPDVKDKGVTTKYLLKASRGDVFTISQDRYRHYRGELQKTVTKAELQDIILTLTDKHLGFDADSLPKKDWLVDCIYSLAPEHPIFSSSRAILLREFPEE